MHSVDICRTRIGSVSYCAYTLYGRILVLSGRILVWIVCIVHVQCAADGIVFILCVNRAMAVRHFGSVGAVDIASTPDYPSFLVLRRRVCQSRIGAHCSESWLRLRSN